MPLMALFLNFVLVCGFLFGSVQSSRAQEGECRANTQFVVTVSPSRAPLNSPIVITIGPVMDITRGFRELPITYKPTALRIKNVFGDIEFNISLDRTNDLEPTAITVERGPRNRWTIQLPATFATVGLKTIDLEVEPLSPPSDFENSSSSREVLCNVASWMGDPPPTAGKDFPQNYYVQLNPSSGEQGRTFFFKVHKLTTSGGVPKRLIMEHDNFFEYTGYRHHLELNDLGEATFHSDTFHPEGVYDIHLETDQHIFHNKRMFSLMREGSRPGRRFRVGIAHYDHGFVGTVFTIHIIRNRYDLAPAFVKLRTTQHEFQVPVRLSDSDRGFEAHWHATQAGVFSIDIIDSDGGIHHQPDPYITVNPFDILATQNEECMPVMPGHNNPDQRRLNIVFVGINQEDADLPYFDQFLKEFVRPRLIRRYYFNREEKIPSFSHIEPFHSFLHQTNFWYVPRFHQVREYQTGRDHLGPEATGPAMELASSCPFDNAKIVALINWHFRTNASSIARIYLSDTVLKDPNKYSMFFKIIFHEIGHSIGDLLDEYVEREREPSTVFENQPQCYGPSTYESCQARSYWSYQIGSCRNNPECGIDRICRNEECHQINCFPGSCYRGNLWRPTYNSLMRFNGGLPYEKPSYGKISEEILCNRIETIVGSREGICRER